MDSGGRFRNPISVSASCSNRQGLVDDIALWARHGVRIVSIPAGKLGAGDARRVADAGLEVTSVLTLGTRLDSQETWPRYREELHELFGVASAVRAHYVALTTGSAGQMPWDEATDAFGALLAPLVPGASAPLLVEHTNQLRSDLSFVFRLRDAVDLARVLGIGVLMETTACWQERGILETIADAVATIGLVHMADLGPVVVSTPDRLVPGDGIIPLTAMAKALMAGGYEGAFELEYVGPRIESMGYDAALARAVPALTRILTSAASELAGRTHGPGGPGPDVPGAPPDGKPA